VRGDYIVKSTLSEIGGSPKRGPEVANLLRDVICPWHVPSGFTRKSRGRLSPPPGSECTRNAGSGGLAQDYGSSCSESISFSLCRRLLARPGRKLAALLAYRRPRAPVTRIQRCSSVRLAYSVGVASECVLIVYIVTIRGLRRIPMSPQRRGALPGTPVTRRS
jgi:hypothetical protein